MATSISALLGGGIKSVQRGVSTGNVDITITAVNPQKAFVNLTTVGQEDARSWTRQLSLVNATTLRLISSGINSSGMSMNVPTGWEVVEFA